MYTIPRADQELLDGLRYKQKLDAVDRAILVNAEFLAQIVEDTEIFDEPEDQRVSDEHGVASHPPSHNHSHIPGQLLVVDSWFSG